MRHWASSMKIHLLLVALAVLTLSGCMNDPPAAADTSSTDNPEDAYSSGHLFALTGCQGAELAHEWVGPPGPHGPPPPPDAWADIYTGHHFSWSLEVLECQRLGWGLVERGPLSVAIEMHDAYAAPEACRAGLDEMHFLRYIHRIYIDQDDVVQYALEWGMPIHLSEISRNIRDFGSVALRLEPAGNEESKIDVQRPSAFEGYATPTSVAFFWFQEEKVHRLTLHRESRTSTGDVAVLEMAPPSIMSDFPSSLVANASWLTDLHWTGDLVTFSDSTCKEQIFP